MSWRGKRKGVNFKSDEESPSNKNPKLESSDDSDNLFVCEISKNRRVAVRSWQGNPVVDIREFYVKDGKQLPGKKGISLSMEQWNILRKHMDEIDEAVAENS